MKVSLIPPSWDIPVPEQGPKIRLREKAGVQFNQQIISRLVQFNLIQSTTVTVQHEIIVFFALLDDFFIVKPNNVVPLFSYTWVSTGHKFSTCASAFPREAGFCQVL